MSPKLKKIDAIILVALIVIASVVIYFIGYMPSPPESKAPAINFEKDEKNKKLIVSHVSTVVKWSDIRIVGNCNISGLSTYIVTGDEITECNGEITIIYAPTDTVIGTWNFIWKDVLPPNFPIPGSSPPRGIVPSDEGAHYDDALSLVTREWWYFSAVFNKNSALAGYSLSISFNHMASNDLPGLSLIPKPDMLVVTLHGPENEVFGGVVNRQRGAGLLWEPALKIKSSEQELIIEFEDSWVQGMYPNWIVHIVDNDIDPNNEIVMHLTFEAPSQAIWTHNNRKINEGKSKIASYMFTGVKVSGEITINGNENIVHGTGRYEHSWSTSLLRPIIKGWDWSHITLENGWNIYYSNYYLTSQIITSKPYKINPLSTILITTDKGETLTLLDNVEITIESSDRINLLLKTPTEISIKAKPGITQPLLQTYDILLELNIKFDNSFEKKYVGILDTVGMYIGRNTASGKITWTDEDGDHDINLKGIGSMWTMRH